MAPGVAILAAISPKNESGSVPNGEKLSKFSIKSGTSMACPHVTGAAAFIKSVHRGWTTSMIKSALMTTGKFYMRLSLKNNSLWCNFSTVMILCALLLLFDFINHYKNFREMLCIPKEIINNKAIRSKNTSNVRDYVDHIDLS